VKTLMASVLGGTVGLVVSISTGHTFLDWQYWACVLPIFVVAVVYANVD